MMLARTLASSVAHQQESFLIGLRGDDLQHRHDLAGVGQLVGEQPEVGDLQQFLDADPGVAQDLDDDPSPERVVLGLIQVEDRTSREVLEMQWRRGVPVVGRLVGLRRRAAVPAPVVGEHISDRDR